MTAGWPFVGRLSCISCRRCDTVCMSLIATSAVAQRLGVSVRQVQRLVRDGSLHGVGPSRIDLESVLRYEQTVSGHRGRAWSEATAWAAVALVSGVEVDWLGQPQLSRARS